MLTIFLSNILIANFALATPLTPQERAAKLTDGILQYIVNASMIVQTWEEIDQIFLKDLRPTDRADALKRMKKVKAPMVLRKKGNAIFVQDGMKKLEFKVVDLTKMQFEMNGIPWNYERKRDLGPQIDELIQKLNGKKTAGVFQFIPEANADGVCLGLCLAAAATLVSLVVGVTFSKPITAFMCKFAFPHVGIVTDDCVNIEKAEVEKLYKDEPTYSAVKKQSGADLRNILQKFEVENWVCPSNNDGKEREHRGRLRKVFLEDGKKIPDSEWVNFIVKIAPDGTPQDFYLTSPKVDPAKVGKLSVKSEFENLIVHAKFNAEKDKPMVYRVPNPDFDPTNFLSDRFSHIKVGNQTLKTKEEQARQTARESLIFLEFQAYSCVAMKATADQQAGIDMGSPASPKVEASAETKK